MTHHRHHCPYLGFGLGLRPCYYQDFLNSPEALSQVDWFEIMTEDYLKKEGSSYYYLQKIASLKPIVMHGVSLSIGSTDSIHRPYLKSLKSLIDDIHPVWISDHLCWTHVKRHHTHDLLPMPMNQESLAHVVQRIQYVQDFLGRPILMENISSYIRTSDDTFTEWDFLSHVAEQSDCLILLDINNVYVNSCNHAFDARHYIQSLPSHRIVQFHLAGHTLEPPFIIDTHDAPIAETVLDLYRFAVSYLKDPISTMIERDDQMPPLDDLLLELKQLRHIATGES